MGLIDPDSSTKYKENCNDYANMCSQTIKSHAMQMPSSIDLILSSLLYRANTALVITKQH